MHQALKSRTARLLAVGASAFALSVVGTAAPVSEVSAAPAHHSKSALCKSAQRDDRMMAGYSNGRDPNSLTVKRTRQLQRKLERHMGQLRRNGMLNRRGHLTAKADTPVVINTYVHVITRADGSGGVTQQQVDDQIQVMNDAYAGLTGPNAAPTIFQFHLAGLDYTANDDWYNWNWLNNSDDREAKPALHQGGWSDLNIYITNFDPFGLLGYAYYPRTIGLLRDGVVLLNESLPGGSAAPYNEGDTATHEVGHWLNLAHTFENGCTAPGDEVADTPYQRDGSNIFYCDAVDTCKKPGMDPVHNFMSYGTDPCLNEFTPGQAERMAISWYALRS